MKKTMIILYLIVMVLLTGCDEQFTGNDLYISEGYEEELKQLNLSEVVSLPYFSSPFICVAKNEAGKEYAVAFYRDDSISIYDLGLTYERISEIIEAKTTDSLDSNNVHLFIINDTLYWSYQVGEIEGYLDIDGMDVLPYNKPSSDLNSEGESVLSPVTDLPTSDNQPNEEKPQDSNIESSQDVIENNNIYSIISFPLDQPMYSDAMSILTNTNELFQDLQILEENNQIIIRGISNEGRALDVLNFIDGYIQGAENLFFMLIDNIDYSEIDVDIYFDDDSYCSIKQDDDLLLYGKLKRIEWFKSGLAIIDSIDSNNLLLFPNGTIISDLPYDKVTKAGDDKIAFRSDGLYGYIDYSGNILIDNIYTNCQEFSHGYATVSLDNLWGIIDGNNNFIVIPTFSFMEVIGESMFKGYGIESEYIMNANGQITATNNANYERIIFDEFEENYKDENAREFIIEYFAKLVNRDIEYIIDHIDPNISFYYEESGKEAFIDKYDIRNSESSFYNNVLKLQKCGVNQIADELLVLPLTPDFLREGYDFFCFGILINEATEIYDSPNSVAQVIATYSREYIMLLSYVAIEDESGIEWTPVGLSDGSIGYVKSTDVILPYDYQIDFTYDVDQNKWLLTSYKSLD